MAGSQVAEVGRVPTVGQCDDVVCAVRSAEPAQPADALVAVDDLSHDPLPASAADSFRPRRDDDLDLALVPDGDARPFRTLSAHASTLRDGLDGSDGAVGVPLDILGWEAQHARQSLMSACLALAFVLVSGFRSALSEY